MRGATDILNVLISDLVNSLGKEKVFTDPKVLEEYSDDMTEISGTKPDVVVKATTTEEIQRIIKIGNLHKVPIVPRVANTNLGGLAIPERGGIIVDLTGMNKIIEVSEQDMYMVIEPGVTWGDVRKYLDEHHPSLRFGYSLAPPDTSVLCNCLLDGLTNLSLKYGSMSQWINALEAVLPTGEIVRTGSAVLSDRWCTNSPLPDVTGLFVNFQGTTGIVTKMSVQLWPNPKYHKRMFILSYDIDYSFSLIKRLTREEVCDDIAGLSWPLGKMIFGEKNPTFRSPDEPLIFIYLDVTGNFKKIFDAKLSAIDETVQEYRRRGAKFENLLDVNDLVKLEPSFQKFADFPTRLDFLLDHEGGGLTWIGAYGPTSRWEVGIKNGMGIMEKHSFPPIVVTRPMHGGHFGVLRFLTIFDKRNSNEVKKVTEMNIELCDIIIDLGFIPYKTPVWVVRRHEHNINANFLKLIKKVKDALDPSGIMNPGKWLLD